MKALLCALFLCWSLVCSAQTGNYFLSHYAPGEERFDYLCFDMAQDTKGVMYFAAKSGILGFNGRDWDLLPSTSPIYSISISQNGEIYWAGANGFGQLGLDENGFQQIETISDSTTINVFQTLILDKKVIFLSEEKLFILSEDKSIKEIVPVLAGQSFIKLFELFGAPFVYTDYGVFKIQDNTLSRSKLSFDEEVIFASRIDDTYVIGTSGNKLYSCTEDLVAKPIVLKDQAYVDANVIVNGAWLNRQLLALGTLRGGVIFVNPLNGLTEEIINYSTGLPDNEVFQMMVDVNQNVWVSHDYGFTKISPYIPLRSFNHYEGLQGNILCVYTYNNQVYAGTSSGLFKLEKVETYEDIVFYDQVEIKESPKKQSGKKIASLPAQEVKQDSQPVIQQQEPKKTESKKGGLFSFLKKNKNQKQEQASTANDAALAPTQPTAVTKANEEPEVEKPITRYKKIKRVEKVLLSSQHIFKKVIGIDAKISQLTQVDKRLIASGLGGLFEIKGLSAKPILEEPIRYMFAPENTDALIVSTHEDDVRSLRFVDNIVENSSVFANLVDQIDFIFPGAANELWFCGINKMYRAEVRDGDIRHKQTLNLQQRNTDKTIGTTVNNQIVFVNADGFYFLNREKSVIQRIDSLKRPSEYFALNGNIIYHDEHAWQLFGSSARTINLQLLSMFKDVRSISSETDTQNLWLISGGNELYKFYGDRVTVTETDFPIFLKSIINQDKKIAKLTDITMDQEHSAVRFEVVQPDYINPEAVEFRYRLTGMEEEWSGWSSTNNNIQFPYLPTGTYTLEVQGKNIFGKLSELKPLSFRVRPPYWKRPWFYAMEFSMFALLVLLSFRLSTRYRIVSRLLSLLTIILLITFIQTVIGSVIKISNDSPVVDFFIQVLVALLVLPVEGYLRNLMLRSLDSSGKFYEFLVPASSKVPEEEEKLLKETLDVDD
jgi:hypothetical protein